MQIVNRTKDAICRLEKQLPTRQDASFCSDLLGYAKELENLASRTEIVDEFRLLDAGILLVMFVQKFGVTNVFNKTER